MALVFNCAQVILLVVIGSTFACEYIQYGKDHTMCRFVSTQCPIIRSGFSDKDKDKITQAHNELRQKVANGEQIGQPRASNMRELGWSEELAKIAQKWADQCVFGHDSNRRTKIFDYVGQNVYTFWSTSSSATLDVKDAVKSWFDEVNNPGFDAGHISPFQFNYPAGHYTQLVWAETKAIGCGFTFYKSNNMYTHLVVCNYGPGGNIVGGEMYKVGKPCSRCIHGCSENFPGLCGGNGKEINQKKSGDGLVRDVEDGLVFPKTKEDFIISTDFVRPLEVVKKFVDYILREDGALSRDKRQRPERDVNYDYGRNNDPLWKKAFDFFFGPCENEGKVSNQY